MDNTKANDCQSKDVVRERVQNILDTLAKCKIDFVNESEENKKIKEVNLKLEIELKEARESEKSHRYHLLSSRQMIENLQETVSQLVQYKRENKKIKEEMLARDKLIIDLEKDKENLNLTHSENIAELRKAHEQHIEEMAANNLKKIQQIQQESDTQVAQFTCVIEELRAKLKETEAESSNKMSMVVLEYEEKIQRGAAQVAQLQEQVARQASRISSIDAYRRMQMHQVSSEPIFEIAPSNSRQFPTRGPSENTKNMTNKKENYSTKRIFKIFNFFRFTMFCYSL